MLLRLHVSLDQFVELTAAPLPNRTQDAITVIDLTRKPIEM
jgi:hypothetical protein